MPQVKVASDGGGDLGGGSSIPKCPSAPDIAHHKLDVSSTGGGGSARQQHLSGGGGGGGGDSRNGDLLEYDLISPSFSDDNVMQIRTKLRDWADRAIIACYYCLAALSLSPCLTRRPDRYTNSDSVSLFENVGSIRSNRTRSRRSSSRGLSKGTAGQLLGRAATLKSRTPSPRGGVSPSAPSSAAPYGKSNG